MTADESEPTRTAQKWPERLVTLAVVMFVLTLIGLSASAFSLLAALVVLWLTGAQ